MDEVPLNYNWRNVPQSCELVSLAQNFEASMLISDYLDAPVVFVYQNDLANNFLNNMFIFFNAGNSTINNTAISEKCVDLLLICDVNN